MSDDVRARLATRAEREGITATALLTRLIVEGIQTLEYPGIVFRGPPHDRRAALAGGPDVWEIVSRLRELRGPEERRIATVAEETALHPRLIRLALTFAADHADEVQARIARQDEAAAASEHAARQRNALLG